MKFEIKKTKFFFLYFILSALLLTLSIFMAPVWNKTDVFWKDWGVKGVYLIISALLLIYLFCFLLKKILKNKDKKVYVAEIVEFTLISVFTLLCIINQFTGFIDSFITTSKALGIVMYIHGFIGIFVGYFSSESKINNKNSVILFAINIILLTLSVYLFAKNILEDIIIIWGFAFVLLALTIFFIVIGIVAMPKRTKKKKGNN